MKWLIVTGSCVWKYLWKTFGCKSFFEPKFARVFQNV